MEYAKPKNKNSNNMTQYDWFPKRVKIQRSLVQNLSKIQQRLKIIGGFLTFWWVKIPPNGHNKFWGSK